MFLLCVYGINSRQGPSWAAFITSAPSEDHVGRPNTIVGVSYDVVGLSSDVVGMSSDVGGRRKTVGCKSSDYRGMTSIGEDHG